MVTINKYYNTYLANEQRAAVHTASHMEVQPTEIEVSASILIGESVILNNIGASLFQNNQYMDAMVSFREAFTILKQYEQLMNLHSPLECQNFETDTPISKNVHEILTKGGASSSHDETITPSKTEYDEGINIFDDALTLDEAPQEVDSMAFAIVLYNMAKVHHRMNEVDSAIQLYCSALVEAEKYSSKDVDQTILFGILHSIGQLCHSIGELTVARLVYMLALSLAHQIHGNTHWIVASTLNCVAIVNYYMSNETNQAIQLLQEALHVQMRLNANDQKYTATLWNNLGRVYFQREDYNEAMDAYRKALDIRTKEYGNFHLDVAATLFNIGQTHHQKAELDPALEYYNLFLKITGEILGWSHSDVAAVFSLLGQVHHQKEDHSKALHSYEKALAIEKTVYGQYSRKVATTLNKIGGLYYDNGKFDHALHAYGKGLRIEMKILEPNNSDIFITMTNIAEIHTHKAEYGKALALYKRVLSLQIKHLGYDHPDIIATLDNIGNVLHQKGTYHEALQVYQESLRLRLKTNTMHQFECDSSKEFDLDTQLSELLDTTKKLQGSNDCKPTFTLFNIALIYHQKGDLELAMKYFNWTLQFEKASFEDKYEDISMTLCHIGQIYHQWGQLDKALETFEESLHLQITHLGSNHVTVAKTLLDIGSIQREMGNISKMMEVYNVVSRIYRENGMSEDDLIVFDSYHSVFDETYHEAAAAA